REKLGVKYFKAIDKTNFTLPPSGWCTWYYYYQQINETEVKQNARWIAANLFVESAGLDAVTLKWSAQYYLNAGYQVYLNGALAGFTPTNTFTLRGLDPETNYTVGVATVWEDGTASEKTTELKFTIQSLLPRELSLATLTPLRPGVGGRGAEINRSLTGRPLSIGGQRYESGIGARANFEIEYDLRGLFDTLSARVGVDDGTVNQNGTVEF